MQNNVRDARFRDLQTKLERDFPGINDPTTEQYYYARLSGNEWKRIWIADRMKAEQQLARMLRREE